jgi:hypothetical protein
MCSHTHALRRSSLAASLLPRLWGLEACLLPSHQPLRARAVTAATPVTPHPATPRATTTTPVTPHPATPLATTRLACCPHPCHVPCPLTPCLPTVPSRPRSTPHDAPWCSTELLRGQRMEHTRTARQQHVPRTRASNTRTTQHVPPTRACPDKKGLGRQDGEPLLHVRLCALLYVRLRQREQPRREGPGKKAPRSRPQQALSLVRATVPGLSRPFPSFAARQVASRTRVRNSSLGK